MRFLLVFALLLLAVPAAADDRDAFCRQEAESLDNFFRQIKALHLEGRDMEAEGMEGLIVSKAKKFASICLEIGSCPHTVSLLEGRMFQEVSPNFSAHQELYQKRKAICPAIEQEFVMPSGEFTFSVAECEQEAKNWDSATQEWFNGDAPPPRYVREFF